METQLPALASRGMLRQRIAKLFAMEKISLTDIDDFTNANAGTFKTRSTKS